MKSKKRGVENETILISERETWNERNKEGQNGPLEKGDGSFHWVYSCIFEIKMDECVIDVRTGGIKDI